MFEIVEISDTVGIYVDIRGTVEHVFGESAVSEITAAANHVLGIDDTVCECGNASERLVEVYGTVGEREHLAGSYVQVHIAVRVVGLEEELVAVDIDMLRVDEHVRAPGCLHFLGIQVGSVVVEQRIAVEFGSPYIGSTGIEERYVLRDVHYGNCKAEVVVLVILVIAVRREVRTEIYGITVSNPLFESLGISLEVCSILREDTVMT